MYLVTTESDDPTLENPYRLWKLIKEHFNPGTSQCRHAMKSAFWEIRLKEGQTVENLTIEIVEAKLRINDMVARINPGGALPIKGVDDDECLSILLKAVKEAYPIEYAIESTTPDNTFMKREDKLFRLKVFPPPDLNLEELNNLCDYNVLHSRLGHMNHRPPHRICACT